MYIEDVVWRQPYLHLETALPALGWIPAPRPKPSRLQASRCCTRKLHLRMDQPDWTSPISARWATNAGRRAPAGRPIRTP